MDENIPPARRSVSMERARAARRARLLAMTPLERVELALRLGRRCRALAELGRRAGGRTK